MATSAHAWLPAPEDTSRDLFSALAQRLLTTLHAGGVAIAVLRDGNMTCCARAGHIAPVLGATLDTTSGISGRCVREGRALRCYDTELDPRVERLASRRLGIRSLAIAPLRRGSLVVGIVEVFSEEVGRFDESCLRTLERMAREASAQVFAARSDSEPKNSSVTPEKTAARPGPQLVRQTMQVPASADLASFDHTDISVHPSNMEEVPLFAIAGQPAPGPWQMRWKSGWDARWKLSGAVAFLLICAAGAIQAARVYLPKSFNSIAGARRNSVPLRVESDVSPEIRAIAAKAKSGDRVAQRSFADYYASRPNSEKDHLVKAATWYVLAGIGGDQRAKDSAAELTRNFQPFEIAQVQFNVGKMFAAGLGVPRDQVSAYAWFLLAQAAGDVRADTELARLSPTMTPQETAAVRQRVAVWLAQSHY